MSDTVRIVEMGARDGLQNEKTPVSVADRIAFIEALVGAGLSTVEVGAFVSPRAIPQMVGSDEVTADDCRAFLDLWRGRTPPISASTICKIHSAANGFSIEPLGDADPREAWSIPMRARSATGICRWLG